MEYGNLYCESKKQLQMIFFLFMVPGGMKVEGGGWHWWIGGGRGSVRSRSVRVDGWNTSWANRKGD